MTQNDRRMRNNRAQMYLRLISTLVPEPKVNHIDASCSPPLQKPALNSVQFSPPPTKLFCLEILIIIYRLASREANLSLSLRILTY